MSSLLNFSDSDLRLLKNLIALFRDNRFNIPLKSKFDDSFAGEEDHQAPEVYIARPQTAEGIPGLIRGTDPDPDIAGVATCDIYRILLNSMGQAEIVGILELDREVYNLSEDSIGQDWIIVHRDKFGYWLTQPPGTGGSSFLRVRAEILSVDCPDFIPSESDAYLKSAICKVLSRPCGVSRVTGENDDGEILVYDRLGCVFNEAEGDLIGRQLKADYLDSGFLGTGTVIEGTGTGTFGNQPCQWEADFLCCPPDSCDTGGESL